MLVCSIHVDNTQMQHVARELDITGQHPPGIYQYFSITRNGGRHNALLCSKLNCYQQAISQVTVVQSYDSEDTETFIIVGV